MRKSYTLKIFAVVFLFGVPVYYWLDASFFKYRDCINSKLADSSPDIENLSPAMVDLLERSMKIYSSQYATALLLNCRDSQELDKTEFRVQSAVWEVFVPLSLNQAEKNRLYAHFLYFRGGGGLSYGAKRYFEKDLDRLTEDELIKLLLISQSVIRYSGEKDVEKLNEDAERFKKQIETLY
jgi:hypothetical protein